MRNASAAMQRNDRTEPVAAFEWLVGCNGGLGGWQDRAFVVVPRTLPFPAEPVVGTDALHVALRTILRHLGHRAHVRDEEVVAATPADPPVTATATPR